jgi:hypothetical protein
VFPLKYQIFLVFENCFFYFFRFPLGVIGILVLLAVKYNLMLILTVRWPFKRPPASDVIIRGLCRKKAAGYANRNNRRGRGLYKDGSHLGL